MYRAFPIPLTKAGLNTRDHLDDTPRLCVSIFMNLERPRLRYFHVVSFEFAIRKRSKITFAKIVAQRRTESPNRRINGQRHSVELAAEITDMTAARVELQVGLSQSYRDTRGGNLRNLFIPLQCTRTQFFP